MAETEGETEPQLLGIGLPPLVSASLPTNSIGRDTTLVRRQRLPKALHCRVLFVRQVEVLHQEREEARIPLLQFRARMPRKHSMR